MFSLRMPWLTIALASGIFAAGSHGRLWLVSLAALLAAALLVRQRRMRYPEALLLLIVYLLGGLRYGSGTQISPIDISRYAHSTQSFRGTVATESDAAMGREQFVAAVDSIYVPRHWHRSAGRVMVTVYSDEDSPTRAPEYGDRVEVRARVRIPLSDTNPGQSSYSDCLARRGIYATASVRKADELEVLAAGRMNPLVRFGQRVRDIVSERITTALPSPDDSVVTGMALGTYSYLTPTVHDLFANSGTLHLLAASGFNCFIMALLGAWLIKPFRIRPQRRALFVIPFLLLYMFMVGPKPSILRATVMAVLVLLAIPLRRRPNYTNLVFVAAFIILLWRPYDLYDAGFQLSFLAVLALALVVPVIDSLIAFRSQRKVDSVVHRAVRKSARIAVDAAVGTAAVTLFTWPVIAGTFNYFSVVTVPANIVLGALAPVVLVSGLALGMFGWIPWIGAITSFAGGISAKATLAAVGYFGSLPYAVVSVPSLPVWALIAYYAAVGLMIIALRRRYVQE